MNTNQIAAEAWDKAIALYTESGNRQEAINEVLSAIEKATKPLLVQREEMWKTIRELTSRAAHASKDYKEHQLRGLSKLAKAAAHASETCETCGRPSIENGIATHLSGHSFKQPAHASERDDTKRLDWLETWGNKQNAISWIGMALTTSTLREAIDAAMQKEKE